MLKRFIGFVMLLSCIAMIIFPLGTVSADSLKDKGKDKEEHVNLEGINFSELKPGDEITIGDTTIKQYTNEQAAKIIAKQSGKSYEEALTALEGRETFQAYSSNNRVYGQCANGATAISRDLNVTSSYQPTMHIWTELCQNSNGLFVIESIVDVTIDRSDNGYVKGFSGSTKAQVLNGGKTLYYRAEGTWYDNATTSVGFTSGVNTKFFTIGFNASSTSNYYGYIHQADNIYLY